MISIALASAVALQVVTAGQPPHDRCLPPVSGISEWRNVPASEMRPNGLMLNGLAPADGYQG